METQCFQKGFTTFGASGLAHLFPERVNHLLTEEVQCGKIMQKVLPEKFLSVSQTLGLMGTETAEITAKPVRACGGQGNRRAESQLET